MNGIFGSLGLPGVTMHAGHRGGGARPREIRGDRVAGGAIAPATAVEHRGAWALVTGAPQFLDPGDEATARETGAGPALVDAYLDRGAECVRALDGSFALALLVPGEDRLLLAVDRIGSRALFYFAGASFAAFATDVASLASHPEVPTEVDPQAVYNYLHHHVIPGPRSIYKGVRRLEPAELLEWRAGKVTSARHWALSYSNESGPASTPELEVEFRSLLRQSLRRAADDGRPLGCFLSGGTDSSTVAGMLSRVSEEPARTYSIGFDNQAYDETRYARIAARHFATNHHEYFVTPDDIVALIEKVLAPYGQPFGNSSVVPTYYCAKMAREDGVEMLLAGDGGDELFGGNERYATQALFALYGRVPHWLRERVLEPALATHSVRGPLGLLHKGRRYIEQARMPMPARMESYNFLTRMGVEEVLDPDFLAAVDPGIPAAEMATVYDDVLASDMINKMAGLDLKFTLADNDFPKVNGMCALAGAEVSYPLLSPELRDFAARLSPQAKVRHLKLRYFFKKALADFLPAEIIAKQKHGFGLPFGPWLTQHSGLRQIAFDSMSALKGRGIVRPQFITRLTDTLVPEHPAYYGGLVWVLMILEQWLAGSGRPGEAAT